MVNFGRNEKENYQGGFTLIESIAVLIILVRRRQVIPITNTLNEILFERYQQRELQIPWFFWHRYFSKKEGSIIAGPYKDRKKFMKSLCKKAAVRYFRFHPLRHSGATIMDSINIPLVDYW